MATIGEVNMKKQKRMYEDIYAEWIITEIFSVAYDDKHFWSSTFYVKGVPFFFTVYPRKWSDPRSVVLSLESNMHREFSVEYKFGFKKIDGSVEQLKDGGGTMKGEQTSSKGTDVVVLEVMQRKSELMPNNVLTVTCTLTLETTHSTKLTKLNALIRLDTLSENFKNIFGDEETCDVTLKVKDREYKAHRSVLIARSRVFAATFMYDTLEKQTGVITIPDCDPDSFQEFLAYLYCGKLEKLSCSCALNLYYTSDKYDVEELRTFCTKYLMQCLTVENICQVAVFADKYDKTELSSAVQDFFNKNVSEIVDTSGWDDLLTLNRHLANKLLKEMSRAK